ncbi:major capsid protein [Paracoccus lutimaris]|uniref:Major capsid protein E n=1 Tax=Paracoccus lutimaris TaxID=1490030 RepID=A0A368YDR1_9RHOB|nr:major capsid protein [Paracoccus lutimaris]RCW77809.1 major capsid protein E [Paracoccus lutimaris]
MSSLNVRTAGVVDPILSTHARGYRNANFISHLIFPRVPVPNRSMTVLRFGKDDFRMARTKRAPGATVSRVNFGYAAETIALEQEALDAQVPREFLQEASKAPGINLSRLSISRLLSKHDLNLEYDTAKLARLPANYHANNQVALTAGDRWTSPTSTPDEDIDNGKDAVRRMIGQDPNTLTLGPTAFKALKRHPKIKEQFKYTSSSSITVAMLASYFEVERVLVGKAVYLPENANDDAPAINVWGDDAILSYVAEGSEDFGEPSYGYTYELEASPLVEQAQWDLGTRSWIHPTTIDRKPLLVGADAGFLFQNAGAA